MSVGITALKQLAIWLPHFLHLFSGCLLCSVCLLRHNLFKRVVAVIAVIVVAVGSTVAICG